MKTIYKTSVAGALAVLLLAGCSANPVTVATTKIVNFGQELPEEMVGHNLAATVALDEDWVGRYPRVSRNNFYIQGVTSDSAEYTYRAALVRLTNPGSLLYVQAGYLKRMTGAMIPDHLPLLKEGDIVEVRQTGTYETLKGFSVSKEGNVVLRVLCQKADPGFAQCVAKLPSIGKYAGAGQTGTPYLPTVRQYGFKFTPAYDMRGTPLRPLTAPLAARP